MLSIEVEMRVIGRRAAAVESHRVALDLAPGAVTLRDLIAALVHSEVAAFRERSANRSVLRVLTEGALAEAAAVGKITSGGGPLSADVDASADVEKTAAIDTAILAHTDGLYEVVVDDEPVVSLDEVVRVSAGMSVMLIRLVALSGG